jgi:hypothetical protein
VALRHQWNQHEVRPVLGESSAGGGHGLWCGQVVRSIDEVAS